MSPRQSPPVTSQHLTQMWSELNGRYFASLLPPIDLVWSRRLTSSVGMFVSRRGPRPRVDQDGLRPPTKREIRLSLPLLQQAAQGSEYGEQEIVNTLAHEMVHQWQYDILKRRPNHGADFLRKMTEMNRDGALAITIYHSLQKEVLALTRFSWRCRQCGRVYRRQRRTIQPRRHHCGICRGSLQELGSVSRIHHEPPPTPPHPLLPSVQLSFTFCSQDAETVRQRKDREAYLAGGRS